MTRRGCLGIALLVTTGALTACAYTGLSDAVLAADAARHAPTDLSLVTYRAVDEMLSQNASLAPPGGPIAVGSIADIQDVNRTTPLGNAIAELVRSRLVQRHFDVDDLRVRSEVVLDKTQGELMLSRDRRVVRPPPAAAEIVSGTYAVGSGTVYVSLRIIAAGNAQIMAAADFMLPRSADVNQLLLTTVAAAH